MIELVVDKEYEGIRLNKFLMKKMPSIESTLLYKQLRKKNITVNNKKSEASFILHYNDKIQIFFSEETFKKFQCNKENNKICTINKIDINSNKEIIKKLIVYEDDNIILIDKPKGLLSQKSNNADISLNEMCIAYSKCSEGAILNRLDRNTSGLVIFGKNYLTNKIISKMIKERKIEKHYHALVEGILDTKGKEVLIEAYLFKNEKTNKVDIYNTQVKGSRLIKTIYRTIKINKEKNETLLDINLITGATHQIRAHLEYEKHPIVGDAKYNTASMCSFNNRKQTNKEQFISQCLHSYSIKFTGIEEFANEQLKKLSNKLFRTKSPEWESFV